MMKKNLKKLNFVRNLKDFDRRFLPESLLVPVADDDALLADCVQLQL